MLSLRLSPDGQRVAVITTNRDGKDPRVDVAGVVRQPNGLPASLSVPLRLAPTLTLARDLVWVDDATLAVLGRLTPSQVVRPWLVPLGGSIAAVPEIAGAQSITTVNGERGLVVTTDRHQVSIRAGSRWQTGGRRHRPAGRRALSGGRTPLLSPIASFVCRIGPHPPFG